MDTDLRIVALRHATEDSPNGSKPQDVVARAESYLAFLTGDVQRAANYAAGNAGRDLAELQNRANPYRRAFSW